MPLIWVLLSTAELKMVKQNLLLSTLEKIAKALVVSLSDFFATEDAITDVNSYDGSLMEKVRAIEALSDEEKKTVFSIVDAFVGKKKLKGALSNVLTDVK